MITLYNDDNIKIMKGLIKEGYSVDLIYADMLYDEFNFSWVDYCHELLNDTGSIFIQTDYRSVAELKVYLDELFGKSLFKSWIIWPYDWGGRSNRYYPRKHDDILWYSKTETYKFYPERIQIPKSTSGKSALNPSGRDTKLPTDVWSDIGNFHTMSRERIKDSSGHNIHWQKPLKLMDRIILAHTDVGDTVLDPFMGTASTGVSCIKGSRLFMGIEIDPIIYQLALERLTDEKENLSD